MMIRFNLMTAKRMTAGLMAAALLMTTPAAVQAETVEEMTEQETEQAQAAAPETEKAEDFSIALPDTELTVENLSGTAVEAKLEENEPEEGADASVTMYTLTLEDQEGTAHVFENVDPTRWKKARLCLEDTFFVIRLTDTDGAQRLAAETGEEFALDEPSVRYVTNDVYIREQPSVDSEALAVAELGSEIEVIGAMPRWCKVVQGDVTGYVARAYLSPNKEDADAAVNAENAAIEAAQAAAAAAAAQAAAAQAAAAQANGGGRTEVSRQQFPDCDGSGHGYYLITYSDGTTATVNY